MAFSAKSFDFIAHNPSPPKDGTYFARESGRGFVPISLMYVKETGTPKEIVVADCVKRASAFKRTLTHSIAPPLKITTASLGCDFVSAPLQTPKMRINIRIGESDLRLPY